MLLVADLDWGAGVSAQQLIDARPSQSKQNKNQKRLWIKEDAGRPQTWEMKDPVDASGGWQTGKRLALCCFQFWPLASCGEFAPRMRLLAGCRACLEGEWQAEQAARQRGLAIGDWWAGT